MKYCPAVMMYDMQKAYRIYAYMLLYTCKYNNNKKRKKSKILEMSAYLYFICLHKYVHTYIYYICICLCVYSHMNYKCIIFQT